MMRHGNGGSRVLTSEHQPAAGASGRFATGNAEMDATRVGRAKRCGQ